MEQTHQRIDEGSEVAEAMIDLADGVPHEKKTQGIVTSIAELTIQATTFLHTIPTAEAKAALEAIRLKLAG